MKDTMDLAEELQKEMDGFVEELKKQKPELSYDSMRDVFFLLKIAELQAEIHTLKYPLE